MAEKTTESPTTTETPVAETTMTLAERLKAHQARLVELTALSKALSADGRVLMKELSRVKAAPADKKKKKREKRPVDPNAPKSGIQKPTKISADLAKFLGVSADTLMSRTDVNRNVLKYVKDKGLKDTAEKRGRFILIDNDKEGKLKALLGNLSAEDKAGLTFFSIHKHLKHHFPSTPKPEPVEGAETKKRVVGRKKAVVETAQTPATEVKA